MKIKSFYNRIKFGHKNSNISAAEILAWVTMAAISILICLAGLKVLESVMVWFLRVFILK